jgi:hypothetical protein
MLPCLAAMTYSSLLGIVRFWRSVTRQMHSLVFNGTEFAWEDPNPRRASHDFFLDPEV